jgi:lipoprotein-anchoring transpeptidase ErfK/SrfK
LNWTNIVSFRRSGLVCLGLVASLGSISSPGVAQSLPQASGATAVTTQPLTSEFTVKPGLSIPDLPPLQPTLPQAQYQLHLVLKLREHRLYVYQGDQVKASYPVAIGRLGWETPTGDFHVLEMVRNPGWTNPFTGEVTPPGPDNPLGERWIAFWTNGKQYIGFHGTPNRDTVGRSASHGCIRMYNEDVRKLYDQVEVGTPVKVER